MNLDLDTDQRTIVDAMRKATTTGSARTAIDTAGVVPDGTFDWCLVFEELGTGPATLDIQNPEPLWHSAYAVGVGRGCLELAQNHAAGRTIAGRPLSEFQGPAHRLANAAFDLAAARVGLWRVAWWRDRGPDASRRIEEQAVTAICVTAAVTCAHELVQTFGAAGTSEPEVVGWYEAAYALPALCGSPGDLWRAVGR